MDYTGGVILYFSDHRPVGGGLDLPDPQPVTSGRKQLACVLAAGVVFSVSRDMKNVRKPWKEKLPNRAWLLVKF